MSSQENQKAISTAPPASYDQPGVTVTLPNNTPNTTPPGWNAGRRGVARYVLYFVVLTLLTGHQIWATMFSAISIIILKEGTIFSGKNIKWMTLSGISFMASLVSWSLERGYDIVDEEKAYTLKTALWLGSKSIQVTWGMVLALFLFSAAMTKTTETVVSTKPKQN